MEERRSALDGVYRELAASQRPPAPVEAPRQINHGYLELLFACGYQRLAASDRARELAAAGRARLEAWHTDPVHGWLIDLLEHRLAGPGDGGIPPALRERRDALDRVARFKVDRFCEASSIAAGAEQIDACGQFGRHGRPPDDLATATANFVARIERALAEEGELADAFIEQALQIYPERIEHEVEREAAAALLDRILHRIERMEEPRGLAYARVLALAVHAAPARVPAVTALVAPFVAHPSWMLDKLLAELAYALPGHPAELAALWELVPPAVRGAAEYQLGLVTLGSPAITPELVSAWADRSWAGQRLRAATLDALLARPVPDRFAGGWAGQMFVRAGDDLGTNSHFTFALVYVVDRLVRGVLDPSLAADPDR